MRAEVELGAGSGADASEAEVLKELEALDTKLWGLGKCLFITCLNFFDKEREDKCSACTYEELQKLRGMEIGANHVPIGYIKDMLSLKKAGETYGLELYDKVFCPGGLSTCTEKRDYPGPGTVSHMDWESVWSLGSQLPAKQWSGEWWRGSELGLMISVPYFWSGVDMYPNGITLGATPAQHVVVRPIIEDLFTFKNPMSNRYKAAEAVIEDMTKDFLESRKAVGLQVPEDLKAFVHQVLMKIGFDRTVSFEDAQKFVEFQSKLVTLQALGQLAPSVAYYLMRGTRDAFTKYAKDLKPDLASKYGEAAGDHLDAVAAAVMDALALAGGLSVPTNMGTALAVLYSTDATNPHATRDIPEGKTLEFFWENIRFFAPVVGFPFWTTRPTCAGLSQEMTEDLNKGEGKQEACPKGGNGWFTGYPDTNQYQGGTRVAPILSVAQRDPRKWGPDSNKFVVRKLQDYKDFSVGFAEMAEDANVAGGKMNRSCPGKTLSLMIGTKFLELLRAGNWAAENPQDIKFTSGPSYHNAFTLKAV